MRDNHEVTKKFQPKSLIEIGSETKYVFMFSCVFDQLTLRELVTVVTREELSLQLFHMPYIFSA